MLQAVNRLGAARIVDITNVTTIPYPTVCRIVETLVDVGMLEREGGRRYFRPTSLVQSLSGGFQDDDILVEAARPMIIDLCREVGWPITITTRVGPNMMVRESTHRQTTLTYNNYFPGYTLPLLHSSVGKAYLAFCDKKERENVISSLLKMNDADPMTQLLLREQKKFLKPFKDKGYAYHVYNKYTKNPGKTSSLGVPLFVGKKVKAAIGLIYFSSALTVEEAAEKYVGQMQKTAAACGEILASVSE